MAHEYKKAAKEAHDRKLKSYGAKDSESTPKNFAGFDALNTDRQAGRAPTSSTEYEAPERRIQKKKGGAVHGAQSLKRLDKASRKGKDLGGARVGPVPSADKQQEATDPTTRFMKGEMAPRTMRKEGGMTKGREYGAARTAGETKGELDSAMRALKHGNEEKAEKELGRAQGHTRKTEYYTGRATGGSRKQQDFEARSHESTAAQKRAKGGEVHDDEAMDRKLVEKMVSKSALTGKSSGGATRAKRAAGGMLGMGDEGGGKKVPTKGKTSVNIMIGLPSAGIGAPPGAAGAPPMANMPPPGAAPPIPPPPPPQMPPQAMMPPGGAPPMDMGAPPPMPPGQDMNAPPPMPRKDGGKVQVPYRKPGRKEDYPAMDFGSGGGFGRKQKIDAYGTKGPDSKNNY